MQVSYSKHVQITESECDMNRKISMSGIMRHAQQMGSDHLRENGLTYEMMYRDGMVFVMSKVLITVTRRPKFGETVKLITIPKQPKGAQFIRDTVFESESGEKLIEVSISWLLIDPTTHKILRPATFEVYGIEMSPNDGEYITSYKIKKPEQNGILHMRQVKYSDLDYNMHVNNTKYMDMICDAIPFETIKKSEIESFGLLFQNEATRGQIIEMETIYSWSNTAFYVGGLVAGRRCFEAEVHFKP